MCDIIVLSSVLFDRRDRPMNIIVYRRHAKDCDHRADKTYKRCECNIWFEANVMGRRFTGGQWVETPKRESIQSRWSSHENNWGIAERQARLLEVQYDDIQSGKTKQQPDAKTVKEAIQEFLDDKGTAITKRGRRPADDTIYRHELTLDRLQEYCDKEGIVFLKDIGVAQLRKWKTAWTVDTAHARSSFQARVKNFFSFCHSNGMIETNPAAKLDGIHVVADESVRALETKEYEKVLAAISETTMTDTNKARIRALVQLQRWSGLSLVDAVCLSKDELKQVGDIFRVVLDRQKTGTHINNVIPAWLGQELLEVKNGNPKYFFWTGLTTPEDAPSYFHKLYRKVFKAAGVKGSSHHFRHTYAIELLKAGVDIRTVQKALGHSSLGTTEKYYSRWNLAQQDLMDASLQGALAGK